MCVPGWLSFIDWIQKRNFGALFPKNIRVSKKIPKTWLSHLSIIYLIYCDQLFFFQWIHHQFWIIFFVTPKYFLRPVHQDRNVFVAPFKKRLIMDDLNIEMTDDNWWKTKCVRYVETCLFAISVIRNIFKI